MKTLAVDFDGVIHKYRNGWADGSIYDEPFEGAEEFLREKLSSGEWAVFIHSTRNPRQIRNWLIKKMPNTFGAMAVDCGQLWCGQDGFEVKIIPFWTKFWNRNDAIGISRRKLPAIAYIDDRAIRFNGDWKEIKL
jgi:hypothetical protein